MKDVIKTGGEWVSSLEIEELLLAHAGVAEAAVIGVPNVRWGELPVAFVVRNPDAASVSEEDLRSAVATRVREGSVSRYAIPDAIHFATGLPRTSVGKIDKRQLRSIIEGQNS